MYIIIQIRYNNNNNDMMNCITMIMAIIITIDFNIYLPYYN